MTRLRLPALPLFVVPRFVLLPFAILLFVVLPFGAVGCGHARTTDAAENAAPPPSPSHPTRASETHHDRAADRAQPRNDDPAAIPVASSAGGLLEPGAEKKIRDRLAAGGFLEAPADGERRGSLDAALKRFQSAHDLPATGTPDVETVRKLGLEPDEIFRKATKAAH